MFTWKEAGGRRRRRRAGRALPPWPPDHGARRPARRRHVFGSTIPGSAADGVRPQYRYRAGERRRYLIFFFAVGGKVPSYLSSSFAFISVVAAATVCRPGCQRQRPLALGGIVICGAVYALIGLGVMSAGAAWIGRLITAGGHQRRRRDRTQSFAAVPVRRTWRRPRSMPGCRRSPSSSSPGRDLHQRHDPPPAGAVRSDPRVSRLCLLINGLGWGKPSAATSSPRPPGFGPQLHGAGLRRQGDRS